MSDPITDENKKRILKFVEQHKNELVLDLFEVVRLLGFYEDEDDYYYKVQSTGTTGVYFTSCVGRLYPLKGALSENEYNTINQIFNMNIMDNGVIKGLES